ncbi:ribosomal protein S5 domain 2-type protein [Paraphysoderma sedebokerense]|nr:ribosomal protein S5 domain 2-type protein [Paraphysoderma sedebokerense]
MSPVSPAHQPLPIFSSLKDIYEPHRLPFQTKRYARLNDEFSKKFNLKAQFICRAPGRVNLIGEHIDYAGFGVLPMAIDRDIIIAVAIVPTLADEQPKVFLANTDSEKYPDRSFVHDESNDIVDINSKVLEWSNYFKSGYKGIYKNLGLSTPRHHLYCLVDSTLPTGSGLSSSSAFVVCSALVALFTSTGQSPSTSQEVTSKVTKKALTEIAISSERYVGVESGGMDQSISVMGLRNSACMIHFVPTLAADPIKLPFDPSESESTAEHDAPIFVIAHCMVTADKHVTAPTNYNLRVVETRLAAVMLSKYCNLDESRTLHDFMISYFSLPQNQVASSVSKPEELELKFRKMGELVDSVFGATESLRQGWSIEQVAEFLQMSVAELKKKFMSSFEVRFEKLKLWKRSKHVFEEAERVWKFRSICEHGDGVQSKIEKLGELMNGSFKSCRELFECSCDELNELVELSRKAGAVGARLTGAGWGGSTVSLLPRSSMLPSYLSTLTKEYYLKHNFIQSMDTLQNNEMVPKELENWLFPTTPGSGAGVVVLGS